MGRILFFVLLGLALYIAWRWWQAQNARREGGSRTAAANAEAMVRCESCGLNVPQSEALSLPGGPGQRWFCSEEHRRHASRG